MRVRKGDFTCDIEPPDESGEAPRMEYRVVVSHSQSGSVLFEGTANSFQDAEALADQKMTDLKGSDDQRAA